MQGKVERGRQVMAGPQHSRAVTRGGAGSQGGRWQRKGDGKERLGEEEREGGMGEGPPEELAYAVRVIKASSAEKKYPSPGTSLVMRTCSPDA